MVLKVEFILYIFNFPQLYQRSGLKQWKIMKKTEYWIARAMVATFSSFFSYINWIYHNWIYHRRALARPKQKHDGIEHLAMELPFELIIFFICSVSLSLLFSQAEGIFSVSCHLPWDHTESKWSAKKEKNGKNVLPVHFSNRKCVSSSVAVNTLPVCFWSYGRRKKIICHFLRHDGKIVNFH